ncbi:MAG: hypothetical protein A2Y93_00395 [Chloroflexi bacterium RBG_13_68_17]|nr:MAG: hypothetical protein A2Y93_00395 [Chloroflexi bacterium RBG_13_68_17]
MSRSTWSRIRRGLRREAPAVALGLAGALVAFLPGLGTSAAPVERSLRVEASRYAYAPGVITVNAGDHVTLELVATDVVHGIYLDGYDLQVTADPGQTARLSFVADRPGTFRFRCSVTCGPLHPFMIGKLRVGGGPFLWRWAGMAIVAALAGVWGARRWRATS